MTTYSSLGMVKLSRTNFGFFTLAGLTVFPGVAVLLTADLTGAFLTAVFVTALVVAGALAFLATGFFTVGVFVAGVLAAGFLATGALAAAWTRFFCAVVFTC